MRLLRIIGLMVTLLVLYVPSSFADPITFTYQGTATGSLGGTGFINTAFTITANGNTANRIQSQVGFTIVHDSVAITLTGLGTFIFITPTQTAVNNISAFVVFGTPSPPLALLVSSTNPVFSTWDMLSSIGPVAGTGTAQQWTLTHVLTSGGRLVFDSGQAVPGTFTATVTAPVPEPATLVMALSGLAGLAGVLRRRRKL